MPHPVKKVPFLLLTSMLLALLNNSCYYDNEEYLYGNVSCDTTNVTFSGTIEPIMQQYCVGCHGGAAPSGGISLDSYENDTIYAGNGSLSGSVNHASGYSPMPQGAPKLDDCTIRKIDIWIAKGYPED